MSALRTLLPYFRPYRGRLAFGLLLVVASAALTSVIPWILRAAIDGIRSGVPVTRIWTLGALMVSLAVVGGAGAASLLYALARGGFGALVPLAIGAALVACAVKAAPRSG